MSDAGHFQPGRVVFEGAVPSTSLGEERWIRIYVPPSYLSAADRRYPVLYLHDGQNAFSTAGTDVAFGWGNWQLDKTVDALSHQRRMAEAILVAIDCSQDRYREYRGPTAPANPPAPTDDTEFDRYSRFLIGELKPMIDREFRTRTGPGETGVLGSSMGGLCSLALAWRFPQVFGQAASLSGAFQVERRKFITQALKEYQGPPKPFRFYLDSGVIDYTGGDDGRLHTSAVARELRRVGWRDGADLCHFIDERPLSAPELETAGLPPHKWKEAQTSQHNEFYWRIRAWRALTFLFPPP